ncbi:MAG: ABC transporter ATP-binding protein [Clostridiales bacterium]
MIVEVKNLVKRYGENIAVDNMNLTINDGEIVGLLGPNGAGKTTFIHSIIGVTDIQSGIVKIFDKDIKKHELDIKKDIGVVPQNLALYNEFSARENVKFFGELYGLKGKELKDSIYDALKFTNLWDRRNDSPKKYSGGMKRRLNIACAIVHKPRLIIMDEPTVGIDPQSRNYILESIKELNKIGSTIIYTSHYMEEVETLCKRVVIMDNGRAVAEGTIAELSNQVQEEQIAQITLIESNYSIIEGINKVIGVKDVSQDGNKIEIILEKSSDISKILNNISDNGGIITKVNMQEANLEDVFLILTGKKLRD